MILSTKGRYGTRAMLELAENYENGPIVIKEIARRQKISEKYLVQVMALLKRANLVTSIQGSRGGFVLATHPSRINLKEIIDALEGSLAPAQCVNNEKACERSSLCVTRYVWKEIDDSISRILKSITLEDLVKRQGEKLKPPATNIS
jgi:Rrf2 family cysteine metabolism transcriptional repressor